MSGDKIIDSDIIAENENLFEESEANLPLKGNSDGSGTRCQKSGQKCISLRYENHRACKALVVANTQHCQHHNEIREYLCDGKNFRDRLYIKGVQINSRHDEAALLEVEKYMLSFMYSMLFPNSWMNYWWMCERAYVSRKANSCTSLRLEDGTLCAVEIDRNLSRCQYHHLQHDILCTEYHADWRPENQNISRNTKYFIDFYPRKEFDHIFGYSISIGREIGHRKRYGFLYPMMFEYPFPLEHVDDIDPAVHVELRLMHLLIDRERCI